MLKRMPSANKGKLVLIVLVGLVVAIGGCVATRSDKGVGNISSSPRTTGRVMYFCGYDRCRDSGEYGRLVFPAGINIWQSPPPRRGKVIRTASHGDKTIVISERRIYSGPGGLWYELKGGGWTNDLWLTEELCTSVNLSQYSFTNCLEGRY
jgi:hypothetical protein